MTPRYLTLGLPMPSIVVPFDDDDNPVETPLPDVPRRPITARLYAETWLIEWAQWVGEPEWVPVAGYGAFYSHPARLCPYIDVSGEQREIVEIAHAVLQARQDRALADRCAVAPIGAHFAFWSPRNSYGIGVAAVVHGKDARDWARGFLGVSP